MTQTTISRRLKKAEPQFRIVSYALEGSVPVKEREFSTYDSAFNHLESALRLVKSLGCIVTHRDIIVKGFDVSQHLVTEPHHQLPLGFISFYKPVGWEDLVQAGEMSFREEDA